MAPYRSLLLDRRWQRKRLEVFNEANWRCQKCSNSDDSVPLHAHHRLYLPGLMPWQYRTGEIISLCDPCHSEEHGKRESDPEIADIQRRMEDAHRRGDWDELIRLAEESQRLLEQGFYYKELG